MLQIRISAPDRPAPGLIAYGRTVRTPFGLLGNNENALTFALG
jgi:hypothetical protein